MLSKTIEQIPYSNSFQKDKKQTKPWKDRKKLRQSKTYLLSYLFN